MSGTPSDPFANTATAPYQAAAPSAQSQGSSKTWLWIVLGCGGGIGVALLVCCGLGFGGAYFGMNMLETAFREQIDSDPIVQEQIGDIETFSMNFTKTGAASEGGKQSLAYDIKGSKGSGTVYITQDPGAAEEMGIAEAKLVMDDGEEFVLMFGDMDIQIDEGIQLNEIEDEAGLEPALP